MGRVAIGQYLYWMDEAFDGPDEHSLLNNLCALHDRDWDA